MADNSDSSSVLSEAPEEEVQKLAPIFTKAKKATKQRYPPPVVSPPRPKRPPSPPHDEVFADNPDIAFIVMFRSRFNETLPSKLAHFGPQDIERGVTDQPPSPQVESLLCALLALVLNRKKPVERGHYGRALEEAVLSQKAQWPHSWAGRNPLHGNRDFNTMAPTERLNLLRTLIMWSFTSSEAITTIIKDKYKQQRHNDDENQPLSVQPWGIDGDKRRYFLVQGLDDTSFRVYREGSRYTKNAHWYSVAGEIEDLRTLAKKLEEVDGTQAARRLAGRIANAIPTFEASDEKRKKREYRQVRRAAFTRPEPGFSLYEGRTRGKRMRYTYDDDEEEDGASFSDATSGARRSTRHQSARTTPFESGPTFTASGRQINKPKTGGYGESLLSNAPENATDELAPEYNDVAEDGEDSEPVRNGGRPTRTSARPAMNGEVNPRKRKHIDGYNDIDGMSEEEDAAPSGDDWDSDRNEADDTEMPDADDEQDAASDEDEEAEGEDEDEEAHSLVVKLKVSPERLLKCDGPPIIKPETNGGTAPTTGGKIAYSDEQAQASAGAAVAEPSVKALPSGLTNGYTTAQPSTSQQTSHSTSPSAASAYPTPASASFPTADVKPTVSALAVGAPSSEQPAQAKPSGAEASAVQLNGVSVFEGQAMNGY